MDISKQIFLAGDLGGTKTLLGLYGWDQGPIEYYKKRYTSSSWSSLESILEDFLTKIPSNLKKPTFGCIAVAGQIKKHSTKITNLTWNLKLEPIRKAANLTKLELINDFEVLIYGIPFLENNQKETIQKGANNFLTNGPIAIIGAGTGLGVARGINTPQGLIALPSEGGHIEFSPRSEQEWELSQWLKKELNVHRLSMERIVSGTGLGNIASWILHKKDNQNHALSAHAHAWFYLSSEKNTKPDLPALASKAAENGDLLMQEALNIWISAYGSAAGDLALQELCTGGLWIGGGTASKQINKLKSQIFLNALRKKGRFQTFLEEIPVRALIDPSAGLFGAACRARMLAELNGTLS